MISPRRLRALALVAVAALAFAYYAPSLHFGFFNDDPTGHFRWMEGRSAWSLLTDASGHGYYRPFSFILWQILHSVLGRHDAFVLHLLNILAHGANAALVTWHAHKLTGRLAHASLAGLLFALYPFSYEAVPYVGAFVHPLVTLLILLTLAFFLHWRTNHARWAFVAAHLALACAVLTQENAVTTPLLIAGLGVLAPRGDQSPRYKTALAQASFFIEPAIFAVLWLFVPKTVEARTLSLDAMRANALPFVQALVYPAAPLANHSASAFAILAALALAALTALAWRARLARIFGWGLLIWLLASLPSILILDPDYVLGSPRLFYLASVGVALIWSLPVLALDQVLRFEIWHLKFAAWLLTLVLCLLPSAAYVRCQLAYQGLAGEVGQMMAEATRATNQPVTFVNLPYFFSSRGPETECRSPFVFAPTGAVVIPPYAAARDFAFYNGGADRPALAIALRDYQPGWQTFGAPASVEQLRAQLGASRVVVFDLLRWRLLDLSAAWQPAAQMQQVKYTIGKFQISNVKSQISTERVETKLTWEATPAIKDIKVFAHVYDGAGKLVAQDDNLPVDGFVPAAWWQAGDVITDTRVVKLDGLAAGTYRVTVGMYDAKTGARFEARDATGLRLPDDEIMAGQIAR